MPGSSYRSHSAKAYTLVANTSCVPPAGLTDGDILLWYLFSGLQTTSPAITWPSGFNQLDFISVTDPSGFNGKSYIAWKIANAESGSYTLTHVSSNTAALLIAIQGGSGATPIWSKNNGTGTTTTALGITPTVDLSYIAFLAHNWQTYGSASPPTGTTPTFTERYDDPLNLLYYADGVLSPAGATGNKTHGNLSTDATFPWGAFLVSIPPATPLELEQNRYLWRNDDGSEVTATPKASENTNVTLTPGQIARIRFQLNAKGGNPPNQSYKIQGRNVTQSGPWLDLDKTG